MTQQKDLYTSYSKTILDHIIMLNSTKEVKIYGKRIKKVL